MSFHDAVENRRTRYNLISENPITDEKLRQIIEHSIKHAPSAFNAQSSRVVLLEGDEHRALWDIAMEALRAVVPADAFKKTEKKIKSFAAAYGTILFFEDQDTVRSLQEQFPFYADRFPIWSQQQSGILQYIVWTALEDAGVGANLQHYDPLIDEQMAKRWNLPKSWKLIGEMPFGKSVAEPEAKEYLPMETRFRTFGA